MVVNLAGTCLLTVYKHVIHNIILFGETGVGKSSVVNMLVGRNVANVSNGLDGCTFKSESYGIVVNDTHFRIFDTAGLNEREQGRVPHWQAVHELYTLIRKLNGVSLLIYCMRGRIKENSIANWVLFNKVVCAGQVPCIVVVTGLENERCLMARAAGIAAADKQDFQKSGMSPQSITCVVAIKGRQNEYQELYDWSKENLFNAIASSYRSEPWNKKHEKWLSHIYEEVYTSRLCFRAQSRVDFIRKAGNLVDEYIREFNMEERASKRLKATLLRAERRFINRNSLFDRL